VKATRSDLQKLGGEPARAGNYQRAEGLILPVDTKSTWPEPNWLQRFRRRNGDTCTLGREWCPLRPPGAQQRVLAWADTANPTLGHVPTGAQSTSLGGPGCRPLGGR